MTAHYTLAQIYEQLGDPVQAAHHRQEHEKYLPDYNAQDRAISNARRADPAADHAAQATVIYPLQRAGAPDWDTMSLLDDFTGSTSGVFCRTAKDRFNPKGTGSSSPGLADSRGLPWVAVLELINPERVEYQRLAKRMQPSQGCEFSFTQGCSFVATLGCKIQSLWD